MSQDCVCNGNSSHCCMPCQPKQPAGPFCTNFREVSRSPGCSARGVNDIVPQARSSGLDAGKCCLGSQLFKVLLCSRRNVDVRQPHRAAGHLQKVASKWKNFGETKNYRQGLVLQRNTDSVESGCTDGSRPVSGRSLCFPTRNLPDFASFFRTLGFELGWAKFQRNELSSGWATVSLTRAESVVPKARPLFPMKGHHRREAQNDEEAFGLVVGDVA